MKPDYERDGITLYCGDNVAVMSEMPAESIDLVVTSPPYDNLRTYGGHTWEFEGVAAQLKRLLKPGGVIVWVVNDATVDGSETGTSFRQALHFKDIGLRLHDTMIWNKPPAGANGSMYCYSQSSEYMFVIAAGCPKTVNRIADRKNESAGTWQHKSAGGRAAKFGAKDTQPIVRVPEYGLRTNVWSIDVGGDGNSHPAIFPETLARDHILSWSNEGDTILDCFSGSGTTIKMARETGRKGIGIEVNPEYCEITRKRLSQRILFANECEVTNAL